MNISAVPPAFGIEAAAGQVALRSTRVALRAPVPLGRKMRVTRYRESALILAENRPRPVKNKVVAVVAVRGLAGISTAKRGEVVALPRGTATGVARKSAATADKMSVDAVCSIAI